jgi:uncharacterized membrane protein YphA (DoxX/SURF4 family)
VSTQTFIAGGTLAVAAVLLLFGSGKLRPRPQHDARIPSTAADVMLARLPSGVRRTFWPALGAAEVVLGIWLVLSPSTRLPSLVAAATFTAMLAYLVWAKRRHPGKSCGCSGRRHEPVTARSIGRGLFLVGLTAFSGFGTHASAGWSAFTTPSAVTVALLDGVLLAVLSVGTSRWERLQIWLINLKESFGVRRVSDEAVRQTIEATVIWQDILASCAASSFTPVLHDSWRQGAWQTLEYAVSWCGSEATAIAAHHLSAEPPWIKLVILTRGDVVASWDSFARAEPTFPHEEAEEAEWQQRPEVSSFS